MVVAPETFLPPAVARPWPAASRSWRPTIEFELGGECAVRSARCVLLDAPAVTVIAKPIDGGPPPRRQRLRPLEFYAPQIGASHHDQWSRAAALLTIFWYLACP